MALVQKEVLQASGLAGITADLTAQLDAAIAAVETLTPQEEAGTSKTIADADANTGTRYTSATLVTVTLPATGVAVGHVSAHLQGAAGQVRFISDGSSTVEAYPSGADRTEGQGALATLWQRAQGVWVVSGQIN